MIEHSSVARRSRPTIATGSLIDPIPAQKLSPQNCPRDDHTVGPLNRQGRAMFGGGMLCSCVSGAQISLSDAQMRCRRSYWTSVGQLRVLVMPETTLPKVSFPRYVFGARTPSEARS